MNYDPLPKSNYMPILGRWWLWVHVQPTSGPDFPPVLSIDFKNFAKTSPKISDLSDCSTIFLRFSPPHLQWQRLAPVFPKQLRLHRPRAPWRGQIRTQHRDFFPVFLQELMRNSRGNHWKPWEMTVQTTVSTCFSRADFRNESNLIFLGLGEIRDNWVDISYGYVSEIGYTHHKITIFRWNEGPITLRILAEVETWATRTYLHNFTYIYRWRGNTSTNMGNHFRKTLKATRSWVAMLVSHVMAPQWLEQKGAWDPSGYCLVTERVISTALHLIPRFESCKNKDLTKCCNGVPCLTSCWKSWTLKFRAGKSLFFLYKLCKSIA